jgi:hypothetical protein
MEQPRVQGLERERLNELARKADLPAEELLRRWVRLLRPDWGMVHEHDKDPKRFDVHLWVNGLTKDELFDLLRALPTIKSLDLEFEDDSLAKALDGRKLLKPGLREQTG